MIAFFLIVQNINYCPVTQEVTNSLLSYLKLTFGE